MNTKTITDKTLHLCGGNNNVALGLSGGPDSIFLFHVLKDMHKKGDINLICAHLNHGWRSESNKDEEFCRKLCATYNIPFISKRASGMEPVKANGSKEEVGRKLRRRFFEEVNTGHIALAHHLGDQQETFIWRIIRGSTLSGLGCMKEKDRIYIRPLLNITKEEILQYLEEHNLNYITDLSNESDDFLRNRIRKKVIPAIKECDDRFDKKFSDTLKILQEENEFLSHLTDETYVAVFSDGKGNLKHFSYFHPVQQKRLVLSWLIKNRTNFNPSNSFLIEILRFLKSPRGGSHTLGPKWKIIKQKNNFWLEKIYLPSHALP